MIGDLIAYLVVAIAGLFAIWRLLPRSLKQRAMPFVVHLFGRRMSAKLENAGGCGGCDNCNACDTPAGTETHPILFRK